ncbi:cupin domain-containing protein (plasmid) [Amycolatopsis sp. AA4]|uniref:cupin domain-containing protein n=1 Tax=Actinomycetes TaxID=1760 RepID=UPI0001B556B6|nr:MULTISPECIES: cupin domain-containing protein [Actinomycetes]ATY17068.1 cupin domain-containing protein [Amycolatopsis sp. AA4]
MSADLDPAVPAIPQPRRAREKPFHTNVYELPSVRGKQQQVLTPAVHAGVAPVRRLAVGAVEMPGGHSTYAHEHPESEIVVIVVEGIAASLCGEDMTPVLHRPGSVIWIPPGVAHAAVNLHPRARVLGFEARTDRTFGEDTVLRPDLDALVDERVHRLRRDYARGRLDARLRPAAVPVLREGA